MIETDAIIVSLRAVADLGGPAILELPRQPVGLPEGSFVLDSFMNYTADCLIGKSLPTSKGTLSKEVEPEHDGI